MRHTKSVFIIALALIGLSLATSDLARSQTPNVDSAILSEVLSLLRDLGYVPGAATQAIDQETADALTLFLRAENPPRLSVLSGSHESNLVQYRDILRRIIEQARLDESRPLVYVEAPQGRVRRDQFAVDRIGRRAISTDDSTLKCWDATTGMQRWSVHIPKVIGSPRIAISQDGRYSVVAGTAIRIYDNETGKVLRTFRTRRKGDGQFARVDSIAMRPGGTELIVGDKTDHETDNVVVYDWQSGRFVGELGKHDKVSWTDQGKTYSFVRTWVTSISVSSNGRYAVSAGYDFGVRVWDLVGRKLVRFIPGPPRVRFERPVLFNDDRTIAAKVALFNPNDAFEGKLYFFDIGSGSAVYQTVGLSDDYWPAADGKALYLRDEGKRLLLDATGTTQQSWSDPISWTDLWSHVGGPTDVFFSMQDGRIVASTREGRPLWKSTTGKQGFGDLVFTSHGVAGGFLFRQPGELLKFDDATGAVERAAQVVNSFGVAWSPEDPFVTQDGRIIGHYHDPFLYFEGKEVANAYVHSANGKFLCATKETLARPPDVFVTSRFDRSAAGLIALWSGETAVLFDDRRCSVRRRIALKSATPGQAIANTDVRIPPFLKGFPSGLRFSSNGRTLFAWRSEAAIQAFDVSTGKRTAVYSTALDNGTPPMELLADFLKAQQERLVPIVYDVIPIPNSRKFLAFIRGTEYTQNAYKKTLILVFEEGNSRWIAAYQLASTGGHLAAVDQSGTRLLAEFPELGVQTFDVMTGRQLVGFVSQPGYIKRLGFSTNGRLVFALSGDGALRTYDSTTGALLVTTFVLSDDSWVSITPEGFFAGSEAGGKLVRVKSGANIFDVEQFYQALYRPDLVRVKLAGDPQGRVREAAARIDLSKAVASGSAPRVAIAAPAAGASVQGDQVRVEATVTDQGGGISRVEWRVNGVTLGVEERGVGRVTEPGGGPSGAGAPAPSSATSAAVKVSRTLGLLPGENRIAVLAYNAAGLIASDLAEIVVASVQEKAAVVPRLHVLAVGVNDYWDSALRLNFAVADAKALSEGLRQAGGKLYERAEITTVLDEEATASKLDSVFTELGKKVRPQDVFVFFLAGHGKTVDARFYFLPQDFRYSGEDSITKLGIGQDRLQEWFSRIKAQKSVLLFDACESGSLVGQRIASRGMEEKTAIDRLTRAMGRTMLTATTDNKPAMEGHRGHGAFTYTLLAGLGEADATGDGVIDVTELAQYVDRKLPDLTYEVFKLRQVPQMSIVGSNFPIVSKTSLFSPTGGATATAIPTAPTHVVIAPTTVRQSADAMAQSVVELPAGLQVVLIETAQGWALVARDGKKLGWVERSKLVRPQ